MKEGPPGRPLLGPSSRDHELMQYLEDAIESLAAADPTTDTTPNFRKALESLEALRSQIEGLERSAVPRGVGDRVIGATWELTSGQVNEALELLRRIRADWAAQGSTAEEGPPRST